MTANPPMVALSPAVSSDTTVRLVSSESAFAELHAPWTELLSLANISSVFLTHEWFDAAWQWRRTRSKLHMLCLFNAQRLTAVLPLVAQAAKVRGFPVRELSFLTVPDTQWCDLIVSETQAADAAVSLASELQRRRRDWDVLRLEYLSAQSVAGRAFRKAVAQLGFPTRAAEGPGNPCIALDTSWTEYYTTRTRSLKKANNLAANRLNRAGTLRVDWHSPDADAAGSIDGVVDQVVSISAKSWKSRTGNSLDNPGPQAFIRRLSALANQHRWLSIWHLYLDDRPVAMEYQLVAGGDVFGLRSDFDPALEDISPGAFLNRHMIEQLFGRGLHRYYMGPGNNAYKYRWADRVEPVTELTVYGRTLAGRALALWEIALKPKVIRLRSRLRRRRNSPPETADD